MRTTILALALAITLFASPAFAEEPPLFLFNEDFAPYSMINNGRPAGIDVDILTEAAKRAGIAFNMEFKPWDQALTMLEKGDCAAAVGLFRTPEREQIGMFMDGAPIHTSDYVLFTKVGSKLAFNTYKDLSGKIIGRVAGTNLGPDFTQALDANMLEIKEYKDLAAALMGLLKGEINAFAGNIDVTYHRLTQMGMTSTIVYLPKKIVSQKPAYVVFSRASSTPEKEALLTKLERAIDSMHKDGTYNKIARHYLIRF